MRILLQTLAALALALPAIAHAEQLYLGYSHWGYQVSGSYRDSSSTYNLSDGLSSNASSRGLFRLRWDTPGWLPDIAASYGRIAVTGQRTVTSGGLIGPVSSVADIDANVRDADITLRYGLPLGWGRLSGGVTVKQLRGDITISDIAATPQQSQERINALFPMAHAFLEMPVGDRLRIGVGGDWIAAQGDAADDIVAIVRLKLIGPLDLTGGWQRKHYKVKTDSYLLDTHLQGWQIGGELAF